MKIHRRHVDVLAEPALRAGIDESRVTLVVSGDFVRSVRRRLGSREAAAFNLARGGGMVAGKTITRADGQSFIVLHAQFLGTGSDDAVALIRRLVAHELQHVAISQRDGVALDVYKRRKAIPSSFNAITLGLAAKVIEEARVERWLCRRAMPSDPPHGSTVTSDIEDIRAILVAAICREQPVDVLMNEIIAAFRDLITLLAYVASEELEGAAPTRADTHVWQEFAGDHYEQYKVLLARVPLADQHVSMAQLDIHAVAVAGVLAEWFERLGYCVDDLPDGSQYFQVGGFAHRDADQWCRERG